MPCLICMDPHSHVSPSLSTPLITAVARCYNEERHIGRLLEGIYRRTLQDIEVVVDSGYTDSTLAIVSSIPARSVVIPKEELSYGRSPNLGCFAATVDIIVAVTSHCYPVHED